MMSDSFAIFIISHGRPDNIFTIKSLKNAGFTGRVFIVIDDEDKLSAKYRENYGESSVLVFDKKKQAAQVDSADNFNDRRTTTHARNACFDFAEKLGLENFLVLDDDYTNFAHNFTAKGNFHRSAVRSFNELCHSMINFLDSDQRILSVCFIQGGDLVGGFSALEDGQFPFRKRKAMNSFFCKTSRRFSFFSRLNEDVNTYLSLGSRGGIFFSIPDIALNQKQTQATAGGMSEAYIDGGTYVKSFYSVMICPSFVKVSIPHAQQKAMTIRRIHHRVSWNNAVPKILSDHYKKS
jgi:hypothetical protein